MTPREIQRRPSYARSSPSVGKRGAMTRQHIIESALRLLAERGFHGTLVDDIATEAGVSRATLYQYFESKDQLFIELVDESGAELLGVVRQIGPLGPTEEGLANLAWWLRAWASVYDKYATIFIEWAHVDAPHAQLRPRLVQFLEACIEQLSRTFETAGVEDIDPDATAVAFIAVIERCNYMRHTRHVGIATDDLLDSLTILSQLVLFPSTPHALLAAS
jgi:AcrR family transcriptional regulator